ncbi:MAG: hypothetical protein WAN34_06325 [Acidimicrobiia bacterium]
MTHAALSVWLMALILGAGAGSAAPSDQVPVVQVELKPPDEQPFSARDDVTYRIRAESPVDITIRVFDTGDASTPIDVADVSALVEIRDASGSHTPVRLADMTRVSTGVYQTSYSFPDAGDWTLVVQPDVADRSSLPSEGVDQIEIRADPSSSTGATDSSDLTWVVAVIGLLVLAVGLYLVARRWSARDTGRIKRPAPPDTWWNSP